MKYDMGSTGGTDTVDRNYLHVKPWVETRYDAIEDASQDAIVSWEAWKHSIG